MRRPRCSTTFSLVAATLLGCTKAQVEDPPRPVREFRAAWIATVDNIDWPSRPGLSSSASRAELERMIARARDVGLNAVIFQVRPAADAMYRSELEPWSEWLTGAEGKAPSPTWDPLRVAVDTAHEYGLELHAWFNPYRARHPASKSRPGKLHVQRTMPSAVRRYNTSRWMDPGDPRAREWSLRVILDVVERYDIDGVHLDDYFYPYPSDDLDFPDEATWQRYGLRSNLTRGDWRRRNVDDFVAALGDKVHRIKPWVRVGISPFGIWRPGHPEGIKGLDQYAQLYADPRKWLAEGMVDYLAPQLYWPIDQKAQAYVPLQDWWVAQNTKSRHLWVGNFTSKVASEDWRADELLAQIRATRRTLGASGNIHFSMKALMPRAPGGLGDILRNGAYARRALAPASPWLDDTPPKPPVLSKKLAHKDGTFEFAWRSDKDTFLWTIYTKRQDEPWELASVRPAEHNSIVIPHAPSIQAVGFGAVDRCGNESKRLVLDNGP